MTQLTRCRIPSLSRAELWPLGLVLGAAAAIRLAWWLLSLPPFLDPDSVGYFVPGYDLVTSGQLTVGLRRTPGYPLFAAALLAVSGANSLYPLLAVQHTVGVATAGLTYLLGRVLFGRLTGLIAGLLVGLDGGLLLFEHSIMTEALFAFALTLSCLLLTLGLRRPRPLFMVLAGLALGLLTLIRPGGQVVLAVALVSCLLLARPRPWFSAAVLVGGFALLVGPWSARNWLQFGTPSLAGSGRFLIHRTLTDDDMFALWADSGRMASSDPLRAAALQILVEEDRKREPESVNQRFRRELGLDEEQAEPVMRELALAAIAANPGHYLWTTAGMAYQIVANRPLHVSDYWRAYRDVGWPFRLDWLLPAPSKDRFPEAQLLAGIVDPGRFGPLLGLLFILGAMAAWRQPGSRLWLVPASAVVVAILSTAAVAGIEWRFRFEHDPLLFLGAVAGALALGRAARARLRRQPALGTAVSLKRETA